MIGTNNTGHFKGGEAPEKTAMGILGAVEHLLVRFPDTHVLLLGIFPRGTGPQDKLRQHNDRINAILAQCKLPRTTYANINRRFLDSSGKLLPGISRTTCTLRKRLRHLGGRRAALYQKILQIAFFPILNA